MISALLLCAGESRRMGTPKALLTLHGQTFLSQALGELVRSQVNQIVCVTGANSHLIEAAIPSQAKIKSVHNADFANGLLGSIQTGIRAMDPKTKGILITPVDLPGLQSEDFNLLIQKFLQSGARLCRFRHLGLPAHPVLIDREFIPEVLARPAQDAGCQFLFQKYAGEVLWLELNSRRGSADIDTPEEYNSYLTS